jgi:hypothetical protein
LMPLKTTTEDLQSFQERIEKELELSNSDLNLKCIQPILTKIFASVEGGGN